MSEAREVQRYIRDQGWKINFDGLTATNLYGTKYNVNFASTEGYADLSNVRYGTKEITLKQPCKMQQDLYGVEAGTEFISYALAHELGHTETYALGAGLAFILLGLGLKKAITGRSMGIFAGSAGAALVTKLLVDEFCAEAMAQLIHGASVHTNTPQWYKTLIDLF